MLRNLKIADSKFSMLKPEENIKGYSEASLRWKLDKLFSDLGNIKKKHFTLSSRGLSHSEKEYLCLLLNEHNPDEIAKLRSTTVGTVTSELSSKLYLYINRYLDEDVPKQKIKDWRDVCILMRQKGYEIDRAVMEETPQLADESLPPSIGWIWLGFAKSTSNELPPAGTKLISAGQPVTISPEEVPHLGATVKTIEWVNIRIEKLELVNNYRVLPTKIGILKPNTKLVILDLDAYLPTPTPELDPSSVIPYTRIWAKVGLHLD
jgi:hypothetical protein